MAPSKTGKTTVATAKPKKEKVYHPESRKAGQLARNALRKGKLGNLASNRGKKHHSLVDVYGFFYHAMPEDGTCLTLPEVHAVVRDVWLTRHDDELEEERSARRKGRPKSAKEMKLEDIKLREAEEYRTGMEVIDLTHPPTVELFRRWDQKEVAFIQLLRFIRIFSTEPETAIVSRPGKHLSIVGPHASKDSILDEGMQGVEEAPELLAPAGASLFPLKEPPERYASTMMTMDGPLP